MEILLLKDVKGLGQAGDIITISDGHARNFLIPNGLACFADEQTKRRAKDASTAKSGAIKKSEERTRKLAKKLGKETFEFSLSANEEGNLYAGLQENEILSRIKETFTALPNGSEIKNYSPIKTIREHTVSVELLSGVTAQVKMIINKADA